VALLTAAPWSIAQAPEQAAVSAPVPAASAPAPVKSRLTSRLMYELLLSELSLRDGDAQQAAEHMLDAARRTGEPPLFKRAVEMAIQSRSGPAALEAVHAWRQAYPASLEAGRYEVQLLLALGRVADTQAPLQSVLAAQPNSPAESVAATQSLIIAVPVLYQPVADKTAAAQVVERGLADTLSNPALAPAAWATIGRMRLQAGDSAGALAAALLGQGVDSSSEWPAWLGLQLLAAGQEQAETIIQKYLDSPAANSELQVAYARGLIERGRLADASAQLNGLTTRRPGYAPGWLAKGALLTDQGANKDAESALNQYLKLSDADPDASNAERLVQRDQAYLLLARLAERRGDLTGAEKLLAQMGPASKTLEAQLPRAELLARQGRVDEARQVIAAVPERRPEDARLKLLAQAQILREHGQAPLAYQMLSDELARDPNDDALLFDAAMAAERANRLQDMERLLTQLIALKPDMPSAYNALGYSLADRGLRLEQAKELIEKAVQLAPQDSFIQDSLGWVKYRMGFKREARDILQSAYQKHPDPEIAAHLGEVLWTLGERENARRIWREGLQLDANNLTLSKMLKRLRVTP
jgi:Flp pilus assembly protein TadD